MKLIWSTAITIAAFALFAVLHSVFANHTVKLRIFDKWPAVRRHYRLSYTIFSFITLAAWLGYAPFPEGLLYEFPAPWNWLCHVLHGAGLAGFLFSLNPIDVAQFLGIRQLQTSLPDSSSEDELVTRGLYRWVRHPLYSSSMVIQLLNPYMTYKWALIGLLLGLYFGIGSIYEEQSLIKKYGADYWQYQQQVPRFIPKFPLL